MASSLPQDARIIPFAHVNRQDAGFPLGFRKVADKVPVVSAVEQKVIRYDIDMADSIIIHRAVFRCFYVQRKRLRDFARVKPLVRVFQRHDGDFHRDNLVCRDIELGADQMIGPAVVARFAEQVGNPGVLRVAERSAEGAVINVPVIVGKRACVGAETERHHDFAGSIGERLSAVGVHDNQLAVEVAADDVLEADEIDRGQIDVACGG